MLENTDPGGVIVVAGAIISSIALAYADSKLQKPQEETYIMRFRRKFGEVSRGIAAKK